MLSDESTLRFLDLVYLSKEKGDRDSTATYQWVVPP